MYICYGYISTKARQADFRHQTKNSQWHPCPCCCPCYISLEIGRITFLGSNWLKHHPLYLSNSTLCEYDGWDTAELTETILFFLNGLIHSQYLPGQ